MKQLIAILALAFTANILSGQILIDKVVGIIGDKVILKSDVEFQYQQFVQQQPELPEDIRCQIMDQMLVQKLLLSQAELDSVTVTEEEVDAELDKRIRHFIGMIGSQDKLEEFYQKSVFEIKEEFRPDIQEQMLSQRMRAQITADVSVTPDEVKKFFKNIPKDSLPYYNASAEVGQLVMLAKASEKQKKLARDELKVIWDDISNGADFKLKAILYSDDPGSSKNGGELPEFTRDDPYAPEFIGEAFRLKKGELSKPFETGFGYHILEVMDRKGDRVIVRHILIIPEITPDDLVLTERKLDSVKGLVERGKVSFSQAVKRFSDDEFTKNYAGFYTNPQTGESYIEIEQLGAADPEIPFLLDTLNPGDFSGTIPYSDPRGNRGFRFIYLRDITKPHLANLEQDYSKIQVVALMDKQQDVLVEWMERKIKRTYIHIDNTYSQCQILDMWLQ